MDLQKLISILLVAILTTSHATHLQDWLETHNTQAGSDTDSPPPPKDSSLSSLNGVKRDKTNDPDEGTECFKTKQKLVELKIGEPSLASNRKTHDSDMDICYKGISDINRQSCCTRTLERIYQNRAVEDFYSTVDTISSHLLNLLADNAAHYQDLFLSLLENAHNKTERLFSQVYHLPLMDRWGPTESLFLDLQAYIRQRDVNIHKSIETFFDELFPLVFHNNVNDPRTSTLDDDYRDCLMEIRKDVYPPPFGGIPSKLAHQLSRSFGSARTFLDSLRLGANIINTTMHMPLTQTCQDSLTRLEYCGHCYGYTDVFPCKGFCFNVMRGCLAHLTEVNLHWNEFIDSLESLTINMRGSFDVEEVLRSFHSKVSEGIMHAMETGVKFSHKVVERCGHPKIRKSLSDEDPIVPSKPLLNSALLPSPIERNTRLFMKMEMFMRNVIVAKGFFSHLPDTVCTKEMFSAGLDVPCWNGENVASYNKSIMTKDLSAQKQNPEVTVSEKAHPTITKMIDSLHTQKKVLSARVSMEKMQGDDPQTPQSDSPNIYYNSEYNRGGESEWYGSGYQWSKKNGYYGGGTGGRYQGGYYQGGGPTDDEDWYDASGSGSGYEWPDKYSPPSKKTAPGVQPEHGDITFEATDSHKTPYITSRPSNPNEFRDPNAAPTISSRLSVIVSMVCVVWMFVRK